MPNSDTNRSNRWIITIIMAAVAIWGIYLAIGAYLHKHNIWPPVVVVACFAIFLGSWLLLLRRRQRPRERRLPDHRR